MADRSGIGAQLGLAEETTFGTYVAPARFIEFASETVTYSIARDESKGLRSGQRVLRSDHWKAGKIAAAGDLNLEVGNRGFGLLFKHMLGAVATTADGAGFKHSCTIGDLFGKSLTAQVGKPDIGGVVDPFSYTGLKITDWDLANSPDNFLDLRLGVLGQNETTAQALGSATAPTETEILHWSGATLTIGGASPTLVQAVSLSGRNNFKGDRYGLVGATTFKEPIENALREITGTVDVEWEGTTNYARFTGGTTAQIIATWTAVATYDTAKPYKLVITMPACRFDGDTPNVAGEDVLMQNIPFKALDAGAGAITVDYYTADATP